MQNPELTLKKKSENQNKMFIILSQNDKELLLLFLCTFDIGFCSPFFNDFYHLKTKWKMDVAL